MDSFPFLKRDENIVNKQSCLLNHKRKTDNPDIDKMFLGPENNIDKDLISNVLDNSENLNKKKSELLIPSSTKKDSLNLLWVEKTDISTLPNKKQKMNENTNIDEYIFHNFDNIIELKEEENLLINNNHDKLNFENINNKQEYNSLNVKKNNQKKKNKENLYCKALDLLNKNGKYQIKITNDNSYILKIKEIEIKDHYFEEIEYAKKHGKKSSLRDTAPSYLFWLQRYYYYSKFDQGIIMDKESWYSVTPEKMAKYIAKLVEGKSIIDGFCGSGGNVIQFSKYCSKVYAIDISYSKLSICKNNCKVYHCKNNIEFIHSDFLQMKNKIKADYIFLSPPWGGTEYKDSSIYSIKKYMYPDITEIVRVSLTLADNILFFVPRNLDLDELFEICSDIKNEIEENSGKKLFFDIKILKSNNKIKALLIIFGQNVNEVFRRYNLEDFLNKHYKNIEEKNVNFLYSVIKTIDCFNFFKEEFLYRTTKSKGPELSYLVDYIKNNCLKKDYEVV